MHSNDATIIPATLRPSHPPLANAWSAFVGRSSSSSALGITMRPAVSGSSVSGYRSLEMAREAGMDMTQLEIRACGLRPMEM